MRSNYNANGSAFVGRQAPDFIGRTHLGHVICLNDYLRRKHLVVFFLSDIGKSGGRRARMFNDLAKEFRHMKTAVIGVCPERRENLEKFARRHHLIYDLVSDRHGNIRKAFAGPAGRAGKSATYIISEHGILLYQYSGTTVEGHSQAAKLILVRLAGGSTADVSPPPPADKPRSRPAAATSTTRLPAGNLFRGSSSRVTGRSGPGFMNRISNSMNLKSGGRQAASAADARARHRASPSPGEQRVWAS